MNKESFPNLSSDQAMTSNQKLMLRALNGEVLERPPFWLMRQAGRYLPEYRKLRKQSKNFLDFCYNPDLAIEATLQPLRRYNMDAAILFSDILVLPDALGQKVEFREGKGPMLEPIRSVAEMSNLLADRIEDHLTPVFETIARLAKEIPEETALIGFAGAPWTVAVYMVEGQGGTDCSQIRKWADDAPDEFRELINLLVETTTTYLTRQVESGAEIIQLFDSWAGILNEQQFHRWSVEPTRQIVDRLRESCPGVPLIGFPRDVGPLAEPFVIDTGIDAISLDQDTSLEWIAETLQPKCTVQGNLDNQVLVEGGEILDRETMAILKALSKGPFIFNLGHGVLPATPPEHVARVAELVLGWPVTAKEVR